VFRGSGISNNKLEYILIGLLLVAMANRSAGTVMGIFLGLAFGGGFVISSVVVPVSFGFFVLSAALTRQFRHWARFLVFGVIATLVMAFVSFTLFSAGGGTPSGSHINASLLLGLSPGVGFATAALIIAVQQFLARIKTVLSNSGGDRNEQKVKLITASIPLGLVFIAIAVAYFMYRFPSL
jgi:hypothetical protein